MPVSTLILNKEKVGGSEVTNHNRTNITQLDAENNPLCLDRCQICT